MSQLTARSAVAPTPRRTNIASEESASNNRHRSRGFNGAGRGSFGTIEGRERDDVGTVPANRTRPNPAARQRGQLHVNKAIAPSRRDAEGCVRPKYFAVPFRNRVSRALFEFTMTISRISVGSADPAVHRRTFDSGITDHLHRKRARGAMYSIEISRKLYRIVIIIVIIILLLYCIIFNYVSLKCREANIRLGSTPPSSFPSPHRDEVP